jgi:DNA repair exonuclease SbcCD nuclease subunit
VTPPVFVHIGDCHMGPNTRNADRWRALDQIINANVELPGLAAWLIPGDLNHARMTIEDRNAWADRLRRMASAAPVVICYGNHDVPGDLDVFAKLLSRYQIYVVATPGVLRIACAHASDTDASRPYASVFVLPYPTEAGLVSQGVAPGDIVPTAREALDAIFMQAAADLEAARAAGDLTLMIGHVNVAGSITSTGQPNIGHEIEVDAAILARLGTIPKLLNHIHKAQFIAGAYYAGSICRLDWGEVDPKQYHTVVHFADAGGEWGIFHHPIDVPPMYHVEGWLSRDGFAWSGGSGDVPVAQTQPASWQGCEVRVRARYHQSEKTILEFAKAHLFAEFAEAKRFELELIAVPDTALRAPEVAAARTLAEKVAAWATETHTVLPVDVLAALPALEHGDADTVIAGEQVAMAELLEDTYVGFVCGICGEPTCDGHTTITPRTAVAVA